MATATMQPFDPTSKRKSFGIFSRPPNSKPAAQLTAKLITKQRPISYQSGVVGTGTIIRAHTYTHEEKPTPPIDMSRPLPPIPKPKVSTRPISLSATPRSYEPSSPGTSTVSTSTAASSLFDDAEFATNNPRTSMIVFAGEVVSANTFMRRLSKREYLVLTDTHLLRFRSQAKAIEVFPQLSQNMRVAGNRSTSFGGVASELQSDQIVIHLNQIVAVHETEKFFIQVDHLDEVSGAATSTVLQLSCQTEVEQWLRALCRTVRLPKYTTLPFAERVVNYVSKRLGDEQDYSPDNVMIFRVVHRKSDLRSQVKLTGSSEDMQKNSSTICYLAVGIHKIHLLPVPKLNNQKSSASLNSPAVISSLGILTLCALNMNSDTDDSFTLKFRIPCKPVQTVHLASSCAAQIIQTLRHAADFLRPQWSEPSFTLNIPEKLIDQPFPDIDYDEGFLCFSRTLAAYCAAYEVDINVIGYSIIEDAEDGPKFQLRPPVHPRRLKYFVPELLAILRTLRWNESFGSISFSGVSLQPLKGVYDNHGADLESYRTRSGRKLSTKGRRRSLLVLELRALAACSSRLRRLDFSGCLDPPRAHQEDDERDDVETGCDLIEAVLPLCKKGLTNVDWFIFSGLQLDQADIAWIVDAAVDKTCHIRGLEVARCGLSERSITLVLESLAAQEKTLEGLDIGGNPGRLNSSNLNPLCDLLRVFPGMRCLRLANLKLATGCDYNLSFARSTTPIRPSFNRSTSSQSTLLNTSGSSGNPVRPSTVRTESNFSTNTYYCPSSKEHAIIPEEILMRWRLEELDFSGTPVNSATVDALSVYLNSSASDCLAKLNLNNCGLKAGDLAVLLGCLAREDGRVRNLHLCVNRLQITPDHNKLVDAIKKGLSPRYLTISNVDYPDEETFRKLIRAVAANKTIEYLDLSRIYLPSDANSDTINALGELFAKNDTLRVLNISGGYGRIEDGRLGTGLNKAFHSLDENKTLRVLKVEQQRLGPQGAMVIAKMLDSNTSLQEVHCSNNNFNLQGYTALVAACNTNRSILALPGLQRDRKEQLERLRNDLNKTVEVPEPTSSRLSMLATLSSLDRRRSVRSLRSLKSRTSNDSEKAPGLSEEQVDTAIKHLASRWDDQDTLLANALAKNFAGDHYEDSESRMDTPTPATLNNIAVAV
ncbi:hypothetical protein DRE_06239 [Drechslerella stenobrocha 248]|uniref:PH domain-containing protein n=1 Tax=Drechslerella stenobrocha 248 TaxID=1043628 RepID=W7I7Z0_9PEZI|nr:hypothetical protein DRE_06239 [Drechslerella stenobrocha 248]